MVFSDPTNYTLGSPSDAQTQVFGDTTKKDMADYSQAAYNYLIHQQDNALAIALMNYQNQYNSPLNQMLLRQAAGINPYADYAVQPAASASRSSPPSFRSNGTYSKAWQSGLNAVSSIISAVKGAADTYETLKYGLPGAKLQNDLTTDRIKLLSYQQSGQLLQNEWNQFLQGRKDLDPNAPGVKMYQSQIDAKLASIDRMREMVSLIDDQEARQKALTALDQYRLQMLRGQNDAILNLNTGMSGLDSFLKALLMFFQNSVGFSGRLF